MSDLQKLIDALENENLELKNMVRLQREGRKLVEEQLRRAEQKVVDQADLLKKIKSLLP